MLSIRRTLGGIWGKSYGIMMPNEVGSQVVAKGSYRLRGRCLYEEEE